ncbi:hypothetical protein [uncultured Clostridium sp.]|uniref:hypothetical protein n=1 Tax=uncultured Clostridium sp. TaxID=59620 RepID=UPI00262A0F48|nr:hypothetical protein [uncultured Clostridium sp.]
MYIRVGNRKILVNHVEFIPEKTLIGSIKTDNEIKINNEILIAKTYARDIRQIDILHTTIQLHKDWYEIPYDFDKIKKVLEDM